MPVLLSLPSPPLEDVSSPLPASAPIHTPLQQRPPLAGRPPYSPAPPFSHFISLERNGLVTGDFNCDGIPDLATMTGGATVDFFANMEVYIGNGSGLFFDGVAYPIWSAAWRLEVGDFNEDGVDDLVTSGGNADEEITLLLSAP